MKQENGRGGRKADAQLGGQDHHSFTRRNGKPTQEEVANHWQLTGEQKLPQVRRAALVSVR